MSLYLCTYTYVTIPVYVYTKGIYELIKIEITSSIKVETIKEI